MDVIEPVLVELDLCNEALVEERIPDVNCVDRDLWKNNMDFRASLMRIVLRIDMLW